MTSKILLTSFQPWLSHHRSNSSDDLLAILEKQFYKESRLLFLRQLPVQVEPAFHKVCNALQFHQPHAVICCGMAEKRTTLTLESCAVWQQEKIETEVNLSQLISFLSYTKISHDAGKFVCEGLYYRVLQYCRSLNPSLPCLFIHIPLLTETNQTKILQDFKIILQQINQRSRPI